MAESELLKLGVTGIFGVVFLYAIAKFFEFLTKRMAPPKNGNGNRAGDMAPEVYLLRFDKLDTSFTGMIKIMDKQTEILSDIRDWVIRQDGKEK